jgi:ribosomal-protein-serine acetyltransferase
VTRPFSLQIDSEVALAVSDERDADALFALVTEERERLGEWLSWPDSATVETHRAFVAQQRRAFAEMTAIHLTILFCDEVVGAIGFWPLRMEDGYAEIGYWLSARHEGRGVMTRACKGLLDYAFAELNLRRVTIQAATGNLRSRAIPERLGFTLEGVLRQDAVIRGRPLDMAIYGLLRNEWPPARP